LGFRAKRASASKTARIRVWGLGFRAKRASVSKTARIRVWGLGFGVWGEESFSFKDLNDEAGSSVREGLSHCLLRI